MRRNIRTGWLVAMAAAAGLWGCSQQRVDTSGPPPQGYTSWEEYFESEDKAQRDLEMEVRERRSEQSPLRNY